jgi:hypothetical protein
MEIDVETQNNTSASETKIDIHEDNTYEQHRKSICQILVSQYMDDEGYGSNNYGSDNYVVTYSREDK